MKRKITRDFSTNSAPNHDRRTALSASLSTQHSMAERDSPRDGKTPKAKPRTSCAGSFKSGITITSIPAARAPRAPYSDLPAPGTRREMPLASSPPAKTNPVPVCPWRLRPRLKFHGNKKKSLPSATERQLPPSPSKWLPHTTLNDPPENPATQCSVFQPESQWPHTVF